MQAAATRSSWSKLRTALWLGIPLGLFQIAVAWFALASDRVWLAVILGALLYLLLPAIAGVHAARQGAEALEGASAGRRVGSISFGMVAVSPIFWIVLLSTPLPADLHLALSFKSLFFNGGGIISLIGLALLIILLNGVGALVAYLGGLLGGELGPRHKGEHNALYGDRTLQEP